MAGPSHMNTTYTSLSISLKISFKIYSNICDVLGGGQGLNKGINKITYNYIHTAASLWTQHATLI